MDIYFTSIPIYSTFHEFRECLGIVFTEFIYLIVFIGYFLLENAMHLTQAYNLYTTSACIGTHVICWARIVRNLIIFIGGCNRVRCGSYNSVARTYSMILSFFLTSKYQLQLAINPHLITLEICNLRSILYCKSPLPFTEHQKVSLDSNPGSNNYVHIGALLIKGI